MAVSHYRNSLLKKHEISLNPKKKKKPSENSEIIDISMSKVINQYKPINLPLVIDSTDIPIYPKETTDDITTNDLLVSLNNSKRTELRNGGKRSIIVGKSARRLKLGILIHRVVDK